MAERRRLLLVSRSAIYFRTIRVTSGPRSGAKVVTLTLKLIFKHKRPLKMDANKDKPALPVPSESSEVFVSSEFLLRFLRFLVHFHN